MTIWADLQAVADQADTTITGLRGELAGALEGAVTLTRRTLDAEASLERTRAELNDLHAVAADLRAQIAALTKRTVFGACPEAGGESLAAAQTVVTKWGPGVAVRQFHGALVSPRIPEGAKVVHASYKPHVADLASGALDADVSSWASAIVVPPGVTVCVEAWHELDSKVRKNEINLAVGLAAKSRFYRLVKAANPSVVVVSTFTGWLFEPRSTLDPAAYIGPEKHCDWLGIDLDGILPSNGVYPDWSDEVNAIPSWTDRFGASGWCVPEFGAPRDSADSDGAKRATWVRGWAEKLGEAEYVAAFEYPTGGKTYALTTVAEVAAWKTAIGN